MKSKLLIEQANRTTWRLVDRECTRKGFSPYEYRLIAYNCKRDEARNIFDEIKNGHRKANGLHHG